MYVSIGTKWLNLAAHESSLVFYYATNEGFMIKHFIMKQHGLSIQPSNSL